jgi:serpin B
MRLLRVVSLFGLFAIAIACEPSDTSKPKSSPPPEPAPVASPKPTTATQADAAPAPPVDQDALAALAKSSNGFGLELYRRVGKKPGNVVLSPASISIALTMTWAGARGETAEQMQKVLRIEGKPDDVLKSSGRLAAWLQHPSRPVTLRIANRLFGEKSYGFERAYLDATRAAFGAPLEPLDFQHAAEASRATINRWVEQQTEKRIAELIPPKVIDDQTRLVLVNALYFLADWQDQFEKNHTRAQPFHLSATTKKDVPTMAQTGSLRFLAEPGLKALELPYRGGQTSMLLVLPDAIDGLTALEKKLDPADIAARVHAERPQLVRVALPKFELAPQPSLALKPELEAMGMPLAFDRARADFTAIAKPPKREDWLVIGDVFHKAFVRVDEKGTEAAAATAVVMPRAGAAALNPVEVILDHPFLFLIRDNTSGLVLFLGRVVDPTLK